MGHNVFTKQANNIAFSANDDKRIPSVDSIANICMWNK